MKNMSEYQLYLFHEGTNYYSYKMLGAHMETIEDRSVVRFGVWAPNAERVSVVGDFNGWDGSTNPMEKLDDQGIWTATIEGIEEYGLYKYEIGLKDGKRVLKADPYGFYGELRPGTASKVVALNGYQWDDSRWREYKRSFSAYKSPISIYEVHLGSWMRKEDNGFLTYGELADKLVDYIVYMGYTHVELLPVMEHPFDGSWGYQATGYFAVTSRFGTPYDFMYFVDRCHQKGIGVILDWVPAHFSRDAHGLSKFDGTSLYEYDDPRKGEHKEWGTLVFDYGKNEVKSFLLSSAIFWFDIYHVDGLRVDAASSMLYLDYGRRDGEWVPNKYGGRENLEAIDFMKKLNEGIFRDFPDALMIAEESTAWPMVTKPIYIGGLGYSHKWNMGWMHDILSYMSIDPVYRKWNHNRLTFSMVYAFSENFILSLSHDEVVHGKKSLLDKMYGDYWSKFANLRALYGYMMAHPGKKLMFMGGEFGQFIEWKFDSGLDWNLLDYEMHYKLQNFVRELNHIYREQKALWENDGGWEGFKWIEPEDCDQSIISFVRIGSEECEQLAIVCNFTPVVREGYRIGVPGPGEYVEILNSDDKKYGGSSCKNEEPLTTENIPWNCFKHSISIKVPPLSSIYLKFKPSKERKTDDAYEESVLLKGGESFEE